MHVLYTVRPVVLLVRQCTGCSPHMFLLGIADTVNDGGVVMLVLGLPAAGTHACGVGPRRGVRRDARGCPAATVGSDRILTARQ